MKELKPPSICSCTNMRRAARSLSQFYDQLLVPSGLKVTQYSLLNHLKRLGPLTMNEFSRHIRLERTTLVRNVKPLEKEGLLAMAIDENTQAKCVYITDKGLKTLAAAFPYWQQAQQAVEELLTPEEETVLKQVLQKIEAISQ